MSALSVPAMSSRVKRRKVFQALAARYLYLLNRPECAHSAKELCRRFACPTKKGFEALKPAVRFLVGAPRLVWMFTVQAPVKDLQVYVDTDFAGYHTTRISTSGGLLMHGRHCLKHWSTTQTTVALSCGKAELRGICRGNSLALGLQPLAKDLGIDLGLEILTDATAATGICRRQRAQQHLPSAHCRVVGPRSAAERRFLTHKSAGRRSTG